MRFITENFIPAKFHIKEQPAAFERFRAHWTPTQLILDADGAERHRIEGFLPVNDFLAQLTLGLGKVAFERQDYADAERWFRDACEKYPDAGAAPEACYWMGVARYKATNSPEPLKATAERMRSRYPESEWAKKASVWAA